MRTIPLARGAGRASGAVWASAVMVKRRRSMPPTVARATGSGAIARMPALVDSVSAGQQAAPPTRSRQASRPPLQRGLGRPAGRPSNAGIGKFDYFSPVSRWSWSAEIPFLWRATKRIARNHVPRGTRVSWMIVAEAGASRPPPARSLSSVG